MILGVSVALLHSGADTLTLCSVIVGFHFAGLRIKLTLTHKCTGAIAFLDTLHTLLELLALLFKSGISFVNLHFESSLLHRSRLPTLRLCRLRGSLNCGLYRCLLSRVVGHRLNGRCRLLRLCLCLRLRRWRSDRADVLRKRIEVGERVSLLHIIVEPLALLLVPHVLLECIKVGQ